MRDKNEVLFGTYVSFTENSTDCKKKVADKKIVGKLTNNGGNVGSNGKEERSSKTKNQGFSSKNNSISHHDSQHTTMHNGSHGECDIFGGI